MTYVHFGIVFDSKQKVYNVITVNADSKRVKFCPLKKSCSRHSKKFILVKQNLKNIQLHIIFTIMLVAWRSW